MTGWDQVSGHHKLRLPCLLICVASVSAMDRLTEDHFSFKCPRNWNDMSVSPNGRYCAHCRKEVFDLTNCSVDEVIALQRKHGSICGSIRVARAAAVAVSLSAAACNDGSTSRTTGTPLPPPPSHKTDHSSSNEVVGVVAPVPPKDEVVVPGRIAPLEPSNSRESE